MTTQEIAEIKKNWESMTPLEQNAITQQMAVKIDELEAELEQRETAKAEQVPLLREKINWYESEINQGNAQIAEVLQKLEALKKDRHFVDVGQAILMEAKDTVRRLSCQVEGNDLDYDLLNRQLSAFASADDLEYLKVLAGQLRKRRGLIFKTGRINPDALTDNDAEGDYKLGQKIGKLSPIAVH